MLVLHPHPRFGGTMGSRLVYDVAVALADAGHRVVRFDFRGVGRSDGAYGDGAGETLDAAAAWDALRAEAGRPPAVVGYSFGGGVATRLAGQRPVPHLVLIGVQPRVLGSSLAPEEDAAGVSCPATLVVGDDDPYVTVAQTRELALRFRAGEVHVVAGAGHFLAPTHNAQAARIAVAALASMRLTGMGG